MNNEREAAMGDSSEISSNDVFPVLGEIAADMAKHMAEIDRKMRPTNADLRHEFDSQRAARNARVFAAGLGYHQDDLERPINTGEGEV